MRILSKVLAALVLLCGINSGYARESFLDGTIYWESAHLQEVKREVSQPSEELKKVLDRLRKNADAALERGPFTVMAKKDIPPSGDKHDYMSFSRYWWPDPEQPNGLPYVRRDGKVNKELRRRGDRDSIGQLFIDVEALSLASYLFEEKKYATHAAKLIRTWFLNPTTKMNPHLKFGQGVPGRAKGRGVGILDTRGFIILLDSLSLLSDSSALSAEEHQELKRWFADYFHWLRTSDLGKEEARAKNNHGSWYAAQVSRIALFIGNDKAAADIVKQAQHERLTQQFMTNGRQPAELKRTLSLHYSFFNLEALSVVARVGEHLGIDLWKKTKEHDSIQRGLRFLLPHLLNKREWPYPQIRDYLLSSKTANLLRMASVRYEDPSYLIPLTKIRHRHPEHEYSSLQFQSLSSIRGLSPNVEITVSNDAPTLQLDYKLPDLSDYSIQKIKNQIPTQRTGTAQVGQVAGERILKETFRKDRLIGFQKRQGTDALQVIKLQGGAIAVEEIVRQINDASIITQEDGIVTLRLPILVKPDAALIVGGQEISELRLSTDKGVFIANAGQLYIHNTKVTSWNEQSSTPTQFQKKKSFRPFISSYIRSQTYFTESSFHHLGYHAPTSYGISLSSHPEREEPGKIKEWPTGMIVGCEFHGLYYGFYSYEAREVAIVNNKYSDCVLYGIDPHDRSTELIIARNTSTATRERHGIIGSRGISNSYIFENTSYANFGSGIMLDRQCQGNVICKNSVYDNGQGIAIYESPDNIITDNLVVQNKKSGIRVRNSKDIVVTKNTIVANGDYAIEAYAKRLDDHIRRFAIGDKYSQTVAATMQNNVVAGNQRGIIKGRNISYLGLKNFASKLDMAKLKEETGLAKIHLHENAKGFFGSELKQYSDQLHRVFDANLPLVEFCKK